MALEIGSRLGHYDVTALIGEVQVFDGDGTFIEEREYKGLPCGLHIADDGQMYMASGFAGEILKLDEHGKPVLNEAGRQVVNQEETRTRVRGDSILSREKDLALALKTYFQKIADPADIALPTRRTTLPSTAKRRSAGSDHLGVRVEFSI